MTSIEPPLGRKKHLAHRGRRGWSFYRSAFHLGLLLVVGSPSLDAITANSVEVEIANLARNHPQQQRAAMIYDPVLNLVARAKAIDLATRSYFAHTDPDGYGPNKAVELAGYKLPGWWGSAKDANYIESLSAGYASAQAAFDGWMGSSGHRQHVLGEVSFYAEQTRYGVGYAEVPGSPYTRYYVFVSAPPSADGDRLLEPYAEWLFSYFTPAQIDGASDSDDFDRDGIPRIVEFTLGNHPKHAETLPAPLLNRVSNRLEWTLPIRADLGTLVAVVERSPDLSPASMTSSGVQRVGNTYSIPILGRSGFMRLAVRKP